MTNPILDKEQITKVSNWIKSLGIEIRSIRQEVVKEKRDHLIKLEGFSKQIQDLQQKCPHINTKYYPDASGNNSSWYECTTCGATVK